MHWTRPIMRLTQRGKAHAYFSALFADQGVFVIREVPISRRRILRDILASSDVDLIPITAELEETHQRIWHPSEPGGSNPSQCCGIKRTRMLLTRQVNGRPYMIAPPDEHSSTREQPGRPLGTRRILDDDDVHPASG